MSCTHDGVTWISPYMINQQWTKHFYIRIYIYNVHTRFTIGSLNAFSNAITQLPHTYLLATRPNLQERKRMISRVKRLIGLLISWRTLSVCNSGIALPHIARSLFRCETGTRGENWSRKLNLVPATDVISEGDLDGFVPVALKCGCGLSNFWSSWCVGLMRCSTSTDLCLAGTPPATLASNASHFCKKTWSWQLFLFHRSAHACWLR